KLLGEHAEGEVRVLIREETELVLRPPHEALPAPAAVPDRGLRLERMPSGARLVSFGVEEARDATALVVVETELPHEAAEESPPDQDRRDRAATDARHRQDA